MINDFLGGHSIFFTLNYESILLPGAPTLEMNKHVNHYTSLGTKTCDIKLGFIRNSRAEK